MIDILGESIVHSQNGLLTTVAYKLGPNSPAVYALEGSVAIAGILLDIIIIIIYNWKVI